MHTVFQPYPAGSFVDQLPATLRNALLRLAKPRKYRDGEQIHRRGDRDQALSVIESGSVRFSNIGRDGKRVTLITLGAGESFGEFTLFADTPRFFDMHATTPTTIQMIGRKRFEQFQHENPEFGTFIIRMLARRLLMALEALDDERRLPLVARLAKALLRRPRINEDDLNIAVTQKELADELTVSRVALATAMGKLRTLNLIETSYGHVSILNLNALRQWIEGQTDLATPGATG